MSNTAPKGSVSRPCVFLDRDGTIIEEAHYLARPEQVTFIPGAIEAIGRLQSVGYALIVITNQSGVARGYFTEDDIRDVHNFMIEQMARYNVSVDGWYYCPYHREGTVPAYTKDSNCRKPKTGMIEQAVAELNLAPLSGWLIGDKWSDVQCGLNAGLKSILVKTGFGERDANRYAEEIQREAPRVHTARDLAAAAELILNTDARNSSR